MRWTSLPLAVLLVLASACGGAIDTDDQPENCGVVACGPESPAPAPTDSAPAPAPEPGPSRAPSQLDPDEACPAPYHRLTSDGRCVWSCSEGTAPDSVGLECVCRAGLNEVTTDAFGRRVCR